MKLDNKNVKIAAASMAVAGFFAVSNVNATTTSKPVEKVALVKPVANDIPWDCGGFCKQP